MSASALPQEQSARDNHPSNRANAKGLKASERNLIKKLRPPYQEWLTEDVVYIITKEERSAFIQLINDREREQFIEQFWMRRNPNPESFENAFKVEHYRRIAFANERFGTHVKGWRIDRGRIYITFGPPDEIESHPNGGPFDRPAGEGGGTVIAPPRERWRYRFLEGLGENVKLEFVDPAGSGDYRLSLDPEERDSLLYVPTCGSLGARQNQGCIPLSETQPEKIELFIGIQPSPQVKHKDLEELVTFRLVFDQVKFGYRIDFLRATHATTLVPITVEVPDRQFAIQDKSVKHITHLNLFGRISKPTGWIVETFEEDISREISELQTEPRFSSFAAYQGTADLAPGPYRLDVVIKDVASSKVGVVRTDFRVPRYDDEKLEASTLILADQIELAPARQRQQGQFVVGSHEVHPRLNQEFTTAEELGICLQLYNLKISDKSHEGSLSVVYRLNRDQKEIWKIVEGPDKLQLSGEQITLQHLFPLSSLQPGRYKIDVEATDQLAHQTVSRSADFTVKLRAE